TISWFHAVVSIGRVRVGGSAGWLMWLVVHLIFLTGFKNRFAAVLNWGVAFLGRTRRQRTITEQQVFARTPATERGPTQRSEERRVGKECRVLCRSRWSACP